MTALGFSKSLILSNHCYKLPRVLSECSLGKGLIILQLLTFSRERKMSLIQGSFYTAGAAKSALAYNFGSLPVPLIVSDMSTNLQLAPTRLEDARCDLLQ